MNALHRTVSLRYYPLRTNTIFDITYYYPHGLQVLSPSALETTTLMGLRYYHHQPYKLLPPWASGITTFNPFQLLFSPTFYIGAVYCLLNCGIVCFHLFINSFFKNKLWPCNLWLSFIAWNGISCFSFCSVFELISVLRVRSSCGHFISLSMF